MILAICPNIAMDVTYDVPDFEPDGSVRVQQVHRRAGGKGVNVARVAATLQHDALIVGFIGGATGRAVTDDLVSSGLPHALVPVPGETRSTMTIASPRHTTVFNEAGPVTDGAAWNSLCALVTHESPAVTTVSGSFPPGSPDDASARLVRASTAPVVLDAAGGQLLAALAAGPAVVTPNAHEAARTLGRPVTSPPDAAVACAGFIERGAGSAVVTLGAQGVVAVHDGTALWSRSRRPATGNPTGAGDAFTAALAIGLARSDSWPDLLSHATAVGAAAVLSPVAGCVDPALIAALHADIDLTELPCP